jgi:hypothetical protein
MVSIACGYATTSDKDPRIFSQNLRRGIGGEAAMIFGGTPGQIALAKRCARRSMRSKQTSNKQRRAERFHYLVVVSDTATAGAKRTERYHNAELK